LNLQDSFINGSHFKIKKFPSGKSSIVWKIISPKSSDISLSDDVLLDVS